VASLLAQLAAAFPSQSSRARIAAQYHQNVEHGGWCCVRGDYQRRTRGVKRRCCGCWIRGRGSRGTTVGKRISSLCRPFHPRIGKNCTMQRLVSIICTNSSWYTMASTGVVARAAHVGVLSWWSLVLGMTRWLPAPRRGLRAQSAASGRRSIFGSFNLHPGSIATPDSAEPSLPIGVKLTAAVPVT
jgi:hypothetical protein